MSDPNFDISVNLTVKSAPDQTEVDIVVLPIHDNDTFPPSLSEFDNLGNGWLTRLFESGQLRGKRSELTLLGVPNPDGPKMLLVVGLGKDNPTRLDAFEISAAAIKSLLDRPRGRVEVKVAECISTDDHDAIVAGALTACEGQALYRSDPSLKLPTEIAFVGMSQEQLDRGRAIGESINETRRLVNEPPAVLYPETFASSVEDIFSGTQTVVEVWDEQRLNEEGCRAILAVGAGSVRPPRLVIMSHQGGGDEPPIVLVGKGVTFDSGGLSLKPSDAMIDMKCDMAGAATVVGVMHALQRLGVKQNVIGLCGLAENMVSGSSYKLGDVIKTRSGKTIEILNTDAEGRVVLADTLDVAKGYQPRAMVDLATLTGACMVALGRDVVGAMTNDHSVFQQLEEAASNEGELLWQLPMFELYDDHVKSKVADIKNIGDGRWGGAITAAKFLENFVDGLPWVHLDIAGPAFADTPRPHRDAGATGVMVRTLVRWIESL
ncbi:leucyl aminopeptidase [bacterium]|nr:leucyl aminopeptidase [bacterium]MDC0278941.1 leucyl aminopeptidase [bacterium]